MNRKQRQLTDSLRARANKPRVLKSLAMLAVAAFTLSPASITQAKTTAAVNNSDYSIPISVPPPENQSGNLCSYFLEPAIGAVLDNPSYRGSAWGILVETLEGETLYHYNADNLLIPASNIKLLTTAAALQKLTPDAPIRSTSVKNWVTITNLRSNNGYADTLLSHIGGSEVAKQALTELGVNPGSYRLADGSGLSRRNVASPRAMVSTLRAMYSTQNGKVFLASLPVAGMSGTLRNRMRQTPAQGVVQAKTGTLRGVRALSGYLNHPQYGTVIFSIMVNNRSQSGQTLVRAIDDIVLRLSTVTPCE